MKPKSFLISLSISLAICGIAYIGLLPLIAILLLPGFVLGLLISVWRLPWTQRAFIKNRTRQRFLDQVYRSDGFVEDEEVEGRVTRIGQRVAVAAGHSIDAIEFCVLNDQYIYAYAYPLANIVAISKGMYEDFRNDDELASVLAHEVAHISMTGKGGHLPATLEESRTHEFSADQLAVEFVTRAGFNPRRFMQCLWRYMGYKILAGDGFYHDKDSTHPSTIHRIIAVNRLIDSPIS